MPYQGLVQKLKKLYRIVLDALFPRRCYGCGTYDTFLCVDCQQLIPRRSPVTTFFEHSATKPTGLDSLTSALFFRTPIVSLLIHDFKFQGIESFAPILTKYLLQALEHTSLPLPHIVTPVPLHPRRLRDRGYNQSELIATVLTHTLNTPVLITTHQPLLKRTRYTPPQSKRPNRQARLRALIGAFALADSSLDLKNQVIWLVDDVATTNTTLEECAHILKKAGAKEVHGLVIAH